MKKSKLSISLVTSFIAAMALTSCSEFVKDGNGTIVDFTGYTGQSLAIATDAMYADWAKTQAGTSKYYDQMLEVLIRNAFQNVESFKNDDSIKNYAQIVLEARNDVAADKRTAKDNAETNGTKYKTEWQSILSGKGVEDEEQLLEHYIYQHEKQEIEDWYFDENVDALRKEYLGIDGNGAKATTDEKAKARMPYHIRHILVKVEDGGSEFARGSITASQAKLLSNTVKTLASGKTTFGEVAVDYSEDSSASNYGDVGIMDNAATSGSLGMVSEFQLGIYAYDAIMQAENTEIEKGLGLDKEQTFNGNTKTVKRLLKEDLGIVEVPYQVFEEIGTFAETETAEDNGYKLSNGNAAIFPRNILWNKYLNHHNIFVITNLDKDATFDSGLAWDAKLDTKVGSNSSYKACADLGVADLEGNSTVKASGFRKTAMFNNDERVLTDENGNVIIGVRSQFGIHLMIVQKSIYDFNLGEGTDVSLDQYYTTATPDTWNETDGSNDRSYPHVGNAKTGEVKNTYVNFISSEKSNDYSTRATTIRNAIKGFDGTYDYRLYELLSSQVKADVSEETKTLFDAIDKYIAAQRESNAYSQDKGLEKVWKAYFELLDVQDYYRSEELNRVIPEGCIIGFKKDKYAANSGLYEKGGACYVE